MSVHEILYVDAVAVHDMFSPKFRVLGNWIVQLFGPFQTYSAPSSIFLVRFYGQ